MASWFNSLKDAALATAARQFLAAKIEGYGTLENLTLDTRARTIALVILLDGETAPVQIQLSDYSILEENGEVRVHFAPDSFSTSRPWLTRLLNTQIAGRSFPIQGKFATYLRQLAG